MAQEIRRRVTADPEMDAINVLAQALGPLDRSACKRVLDWADKKFVNPDELMPIENMQGLTKWMEALQAVATELHVQPKTKLIDAMGLVVDQIREEHKEAAGLVNGS